MMMVGNVSAQHRQRTASLGPRVAVRFLVDGVERVWSWNAVRRRADGAAAGLIGLGVRVGDRVGLLAMEGPEAIVAELAVLAAGAVGVRLDPAEGLARLAEVVRGTDIGTLLVGRAAATSATVPGLRAALPTSTRWVGGDGSGGAMTWEGLIHAGRRDGSFGTGLIEKRERAVGRDDPARIALAGATSDPVSRTHGELLAHAAAPPATDEPIFLVQQDLGQADPYLEGLVRSVVTGATVALVAACDGVAGRYRFAVTRADSAVGGNVSP